MGHNEVWKHAGVVSRFVREVRGGVPYAVDQLEVMLRFLASGGPIQSFVDLGCGGGVLAQALWEAYPDAEGTLVDFSEPMLDEARKNHSSRSNARFVLGDMAEATWQEAIAGAGPFDAVVSGYAIHHMSDSSKRDIYGEIFSLLRCGGRFVNVEHVASATPAIEVLSDELMIDSLFAFQSAQGTSVSRDRFAEEYHQRPDKAANILASVEQQCAWLRDIGFRDVDCYFKVFELAVFGGRKE